MKLDEIVVMPPKYRLKLLATDEHRQELMSVVNGFSSGFSMQAAEGQRNMVATAEIGLINTMILVSEGLAMKSDLPQAERTLAYAYEDSGLAHMDGEIREEGNNKPLATDMVEKFQENPNAILGRIKELKESAQSAARFR